MEALVSKTEMLIRRPAVVVFDAFVDPRVLESFWLRSASGRLADGAEVEWEFLVAGARAKVVVTGFIPHRFIAFTWPDGIGVEMNFGAPDDECTRLSVTARGFDGSDASRRALDTTEGFAIVLCDFKCLLETGRSGNMVRGKAALITADMDANKPV